MHDRATLVWDMIMVKDDLMCTTDSQFSHADVVKVIDWCRAARIYILKSEASVRLSVPRSQRALTQRQTALLRPIYPMSAVVGS